MKNVLLLFGGNSPEHKVSCMSAKSILYNIDRKKYRVTAVGINHTNDWFIYNDCPEFLDNWENQDVIEIENIIEFLRNFDVVFPIIHGSGGEDGKLQGMLDLFNIKYVGCNTLSSSVGMDKDFSKIIFDSADIPQIPYITVDKDYKVKDILKNFSFPLIVKPANGGSSIGINRANNKKELKKAILDALNYDSKIIVEKFIKARELECAVLEDKKLIISNIGEIKAANDFYDYDAKYVNEKSYTIIPADIEAEVSKKIQEYAKKAFKSINAKGFARIDFFYDEENNNIYLNEINTLPGFTNISMYPSLIINEGISYSNLITKIIENA